MSENEEAPIKSRVALRLGIVVGGLFFYVLSIGPAIWIFNRTFVSWPAWIETFFDVFYYPLEWAADLIPWLDTFLQWYINLALR